MAQVNTQKPKIDYAPDLIDDSRDSGRQLIQEAEEAIVEPTEKKEQHFLTTK